MTKDQEEQYRSGALVIGPEADMQERLERAKRGLPIDLPPVRVRVHASTAYWPPFHDPRGESRSLKESGQHREEDEPAKITVAPIVIPLLDHHVRLHMAYVNRAKRLKTEFAQVLELAWCHQTGKIKSVIEPKPGTGPDVGTLIVRVDHAEAAMKYLREVLGWSDKLIPIIVAWGDGQASKSRWGNRSPSWPDARRIWCKFVIQFYRKLERQPFAAYIEQLEREAVFGTNERIR